MPIYETFSKRHRRLARGDEVEPLIYDPLPIEFRRQVVHIWNSAIGPYLVGGGIYGGPHTEYVSNLAWKAIHITLCRELGVFALGSENHNEFGQCQEFILDGTTDNALDIIEVSFKVIDSEIRHKYASSRQESQITQDADDAIQELNHRFLEYGLGYQFVDGSLMRMDSQYLHNEAIVPAISLLHRKRFEGASEEFMSAHTHYRNGRYKEAIADALKAFESTMKTICDLKGWGYPENATAQPLIKIMFENELVPASLQSQFGAVRSLLESGIPTLRNRTSGHGQGQERIEVPEHIAAFALHVTASNIVLLVEASERK